MTSAVCSLRPWNTWLLVLWLVTPAAPAWGQQSGSGEVAGIVVDATTGWPVAGARVRVAGMARIATTDSAGRFRYDELAPGIHALEVASLGYRPAIRRDVPVSAGKPTTVTIRLDASPQTLQTIAVRPSAFLNPADAPTSTQRLHAEEVRRSPGAQEDVVRAISVLPGVAPTAVHSNMLVVRGGAPFENLFVVDGLEVPDITHFGIQGATGGQTSLINFDLIDHVDFTAGGAGARRGDRIGAVTDLRLREGLKVRHAGELNFSITGFGALAEGPVGSGSYMASVRRSYLDLLLKASGESFFTRYWDANIKVTQPLGKRDRLSWVFVGGLDEFGFNTESVDDAYDLTIMATNVDQAFSALSWSHVGERSRLVVTAGRIHRAFDTRQNDTLAAPVFTNRSTEIENSIRVAYTRALAGENTLELGTVAKFDSRLHYDISLPGELRPDGAGVPRALDVDTSFSAVRLGGFAETRTMWTPRFSTTLGLRLDYFSHLRDAVRFAPRLAATLEVVPGTSLNVSGGRYWQAPSSIWLAGDPANGRRLAPLRVDQGVVGLQKLIGDDVKLQLEAYYKSYAAYPARLWRPQAVVAPGNFETVDADIPFGLEPLAADGKGRAYGVEFFAQKQPGDVPVYGLASLSAGRSEFAGRDGEYRRGSYDVPVIANLTMGWRPDRRWDLGMRFRAASGRPKTPFRTVEPYVGRLDFDRYNEGGRMPAFHALDLRIDRRWTFSRLQVITYLDIQDVYNRNNAIGYYWDKRELKPTYEDAIGLLPSLGINVEF
jgi:hypothetical protein